MKPSKKPNDPLARPYIPGEPLPEPEVLEKNTDTTWALFHALQEDPTAGLRTSQVPLDGAAQPTQPAPLAADAAPAEPTLEEVMFEARRNNRVCPKSAFWRRLYELIPNKTDAQPLPPVSSAQWAVTPALNLRICLRSQIEWAAEQGALVKIYAYLRALPEDKWHHMGD